MLTAYVKQIRVCEEHGNAHQVDVAGRNGVHLTDCPSHPTFNAAYAAGWKTFLGRAKGTIKGKKPGRR